MIRSLVFSARTYARGLPPWLTGPKTRFLVFGQGRTGSTLLQRMLDGHPEVQCDGELLYHVRWSPRVFVEGCARSSHAPVYGFKAKCYQFDRRGGHAQSRAFLQWAAARSWRLIWLRRQNVFRHALSGLVANRRGQVWHSTQGKPLDRVEVAPQVVLDAIQRRIAHRDAEAAAIEGLHHLELQYERDMLSEDHQQATADRVFDFLGVASHTVQTEMRRTVPSDLSATLSNADAVLEAVRNSAFADYLDMSQ